MRLRDGEAALSGPSSSAITQETYQITQPTLAPSLLAPLLRQNLRSSRCRAVVQNFKNDFAEALGDLLATLD
jgi:cell division inhibitor SulA